MSTYPISRKMPLRAFSDALSGGKNSTAVIRDGE
jgi:hypothetical protein